MYTRPKTDTQNPSPYTIKPKPSTLNQVFVSYRVATEGGGGNGLSGLLADKIRALSVDNTHDLHIPRCGWEREFIDYTTSMITD